MKSGFVFMMVLVVAAVLLAGCAVPAAPSTTPTPGTTTPAPAPTTPDTTITPSQTTPPPTPTTPSATPTPTPTTPPSTQSAEMGTLTVYVTDPPPPDMEEILVNIKSLEVHKAGGAWMTIDEEPQEFDLKVIEGVQEYLASQDLETGKYTQIRFDVVSVRVKVDGVYHDAKVPSDKIKLVGTFEVVANEDTEITIDFNGQKSVLVTGNGKYIFKPVVKLLMPDKIKPIQLEATLNSTDNATAEWSDTKAYSGNESVYLATGDFTGPSADEARIVITLPDGITLGQIDSISWWVYAMSGYPPHIDITLDLEGENEDMLTAEMNLNSVDAPKSIAELQSEINYDTGWLQTFELTSDDSFGAIGDDTIFWVTRMGSGDLNAPSGTLLQWKDGEVGEDPEEELTTTVISGSAPVVKLEIEIDNWVVSSEAYVDDIEIVIDGVTYTISD